MSTHALIIRGGTVVDGTGAPARTADVAIDDGVITAVGKVDGDAARTIDADGLLVTPGFVDIHAHYDGQASWGERMIPSSWHGVTTVVVGNCGVGFAPVRPADHQRLIELMEGVEDIPGTVLHEGLAWNWQSFPEFMDALDGRPFDVDVAVQVPHGALRLHVMGERGATRSRDRERHRHDGRARSRGSRGRRARVLHVADAQSPHQQGRVHADAHRGRRGARRHRAGDRRDGSGRAAGRLRLRRCRRRVRDLPAHGRDVGTAVVVLARPVCGNGWRRQLELTSAANADGVVMTAQVAPRAVGLMLGLQCTLHPLLMNPVYAEIAALPLAERVAAMADQRFKQRILEADASQRLTGRHATGPSSVDS